MDNKRGFTLIELLIVVVIIGILAAIAIPRFGETRERAFISSMSSDLRNLQTVQEQYYFDNAYAYASSTADLNFQTSENVAIAIGVAGEGYTATATHTGTAVECVLTVGQGGAGADGIVCN